MNNKILSILICTLLIITILPTASSINKVTLNKLIKKEKIDDGNNKDNKEPFQHYVIMENPPDLSNLDNTSPKLIAKNTPSEFSWMNFNGKDWTTPARNQGNCGSCWAFAAIGVFEIMIKIKEECADFNPDLSEQYLLSCLPNAGSCRGGSAYEAFELIKSTSANGNNQNGVPLESCFEYKADHKVPCSDKCENWEEILVPLMDYGTWRSYGTQSDRKVIKTKIIEDGPVVTHIRATDFFKTWGALIHNPSAYFPDLRKVSFYNHVVLILGWKDSSSIPNGGYWICKNSWGPEWGYDGFFNIEYGALNIDDSSIIWADYNPDSYNWSPIVDTGGSYGTYLGQETIFDASKSIGIEGEIIDYSWDFGDESTGSGITTTHTYQNLGKYTITLTIKDIDGNSATKTSNLWIQDTNNRPVKPTINGPSSGKFWKEYEYIFSSTDADGNDLFYYIDWGDGKKEEWIGPFESGEEVSLSHIWTKSLKTEIKVKVKDPFGEESDIETLNINMARSRIPTRFIFLNFIKSLLDLFN